MTTLKALLVAIALALGCATAASAQQVAQPPFGTWVGSNIRFTLNVDRTYVYQDPAARLTGDWNWINPGGVGGVLAFCYLTPTPTRTFHNCIYFGVAWLDASTIRLTEPTSHQSAVLRRQG
jgi:hypothetical protein